MKQLFFTAICSGCLNFSSFAQTEQGARLYSWNAGLDLLQSSSSSGRPNNVKRSGLAATLDFEYQRGKFIRNDVAQGWLVGLYAQSRFVRSAPAPTEPSALHSWVSTGYWRRYYLPSTAPVRFFAQGQVTGLYGESHSRQNARLEQENQFIAVEGGIGVGAVLFIKNGWSVEARQNLGSIYLGRGIKNKQTELSLSGRLEVKGFGLRIARYVDGTTAAGSSIWSRRQTIYQMNNRFIGGEFFARLPFDRPGRRASFTLSKGRFIRPDQARGIGLTLGYSNSRIGNDPTTVYRDATVTAGVSPFREYYWPLGTGSWSVLVNASVSLLYEGMFRQVEFSNSNNPAGPTRSHQISLTPTLRPGIQYQVSRKWAIAAVTGGATFGELGVGVSRSRDSYTSTGRQARLLLFPTPYLNLNSLGISLRYFPGRMETAHIE